MRLMHNEQRSDWWWFMPLSFLSTDYNFHTAKPRGIIRWLTTCYIRLSCKHLNLFPPPPKHIWFRNHSELFKQIHLDHTNDKGVIIQSEFVVNFSLPVLVAIQSKPWRGLQRTSLSWQMNEHWASNGLNTKRLRGKVIRRKACHMALDSTLMH